MIANYHTHTYRCGHAEGNESEYAENAAKAGLKILGFSDHTPYDFFDSEPRNRPMRIKPQELPEYASSIRTLKKAYHGKMDILLGVEAEYYPRYFERLLELLRENGVQYMLLGQHFLGNEIGDFYSGRETKDEELLKRYVDQCITALDTGLFTYFAHPDLLNFTGSETVYNREMRRLCRAAFETDTPLEINLLGQDTGRHYPSERFFKIAAKEGNKVVLGCDAHEPSAVFNPGGAKRALDMAKRLGLFVLETVPVRYL